MARITVAQHAAQTDAALAEIRADVAALTSTIAAFIASQTPATVVAEVVSAPEPKAPRVTKAGRTMGTKATEAEMVKAAKAYLRAHKHASAFTALKYGNADLYAGVVTKVQAREAGLPTTF
jgi:hypothetical protein